MSLQHFLDRFDNGVKLHQPSFSIDWSVTGTGNGQLHFYTDAEGQLHCESEYMGPNFVKKVLNMLVDQAIWDDFKGGKYRGIEITPEIWEKRNEP